MVCSNLTSSMKIFDAHCYMCGCSEALRLLTVNRSSMVRCERCAFQYLWPKPPRETALEMNLGKSAPHLPQWNSIALRKMRSKVQEIVGGYPEAGFWGLCRTFIVSLLSPQAVPFVYKGDGVVLDVGFGSAEMLDWLANHGWETWGLDFSDQGVAMAKAKGHQVYKGNIEGDGLDNVPRGRFDVIILSHVLEHLHDPIQALKRLRLLLKPSGILIVSIPNLHSISSRIMGVYCKMLALSPPRHLNYFSPVTLTSVLERAGLKVIFKSGKDAVGTLLGGLKKMKQEKGPIEMIRTLGFTLIQWMNPNRRLADYDILTFHAQQKSIK